MARYYKLTARDGDWTFWISPTPKQPYRMACCDCGLVHNIEFRAVKVSRNNSNGTFVFVDEKINPRKVRVQFRVSRNKRATAAMRREDRK